VQVEVSVEKLVDKIVEVPVEKIIKEILYIPILTDDPEAVKRALYKTLPKEVADVVKVSLKSQSDASPPTRGGLVMVEPTAHGLSM
jgi:hypothetical protein